MAKIVDRVAAVTATRHDGKNMIVLTAGQPVRLAESSEIWCDERKLLEPKAILVDDDGQPINPPLGDPSDEPQPLDLTDEERASLPQLDHDGGSLPDDSFVFHSEFIMKHVGGGWYEISGPGLEEPVKVQGRVDAEARYDEIVAEAGESAGAPI